MLINQKISHHHENSGTLLTNECFLKLAKDVLQFGVILAYSTNTPVIQGLLTPHSRCNLCNLSDATAVLIAPEDTPKTTETLSLRT